MVRTFCFSKNVVGQNWGVKEQSDNLYGSSENHYLTQTTLW